ncbi:hypothetical protein C8F01DRAFT_1237824 [Mycena amicta]|nr:hypothetical protein C8F01DRAFT_1237824 [Mycena amicta]
MREAFSHILAFNYTRLRRFLEEVERRAPALLSSAPKPKRSDPMDTTAVEDPIKAALREKASLGKKIKTRLARYRVSLPVVAQNYESDLALLTDSDVAILQIPVAIASTTSLDAPSFPNANCATGGPPHCEETHSATGSVSAKDALAMDPSVVRMMSYGPNADDMHTRERDYVLPHGTYSERSAMPTAYSRSWHRLRPKTRQPALSIETTGADENGVGFTQHNPSRVAIEGRGVWETLWAALLRLEEDDLPSGEQTAFTDAARKIAEDESVPMEWRARFAAIVEQFEN